MNHDVSNPPALIQAPEWINDLILYEVATKGFTSPNGPESGTFASLREQLPYLHDLGITGIWLTGHSLSDPKHFYNIWTQYACIFPDQLDPSLGDAASFKKLIDTAHALDIKIFLDVVTHGVMNDSPLVQQKPHWFKGGSWGMTDFDWHGDHPDLDDWWVDCWVHYVERFGVDGFRLDVSTYRPDLWSRIRQRCATLGHPIVVLAELGPAYTGASDFIQWGERLSTNQGFVHDHPFLMDMTTAVQGAVQPVYADFQVLLEYTDGTQASNYGEGEYTIHVIEQLEQEQLRTGPDGRGPYIVHELTLAVTGAPTEKIIANVTVRHPSNFWPWRRKEAAGADLTVTVAGEAPNLRLTIPLLLPQGAWLSVQLSCHDNGWDGFPLDQNPYAAQGSRFVFGYGCLLAPAVPIFMGGEEFDAQYVPLPTHTPGLFGAGEPGRGRWLYASWLQWAQAQTPERAALLEDVKRIIHIRRSQRDLIRPLRVGDSSAVLHAVSFTASAALPTAYLYHRPGKSLLVAANPHLDQDVTIQFNLPLTHLGLTPQQPLTITNLWQGNQTTVMTGEVLNQQSFTIQRDKTPGGGLLVLAIAS